MLSAIVLAAGLSQRMVSTNKLLLPYKNRTVIANVVENILDAGIEELIVVLGYEAEQVKNSLKHLPVDFIFNPFYEHGMTTSIQHGVLNAKGNGYMICLSDMVLITSAEYLMLKNTFGKQLALNAKCICLPSYKNKKGNPVIFSSYYKEAILQHDDKEGCKSIVESNKNHVCLIDMDAPHILQDMDYPEDYQSIVNSQ